MDAYKRPGSVLSCGLNVGSVAATWVITAGHTMILSGSMGGRNDAIYILSHFTCSINIYFKMRYMKEMEM